MLHSAPGLTLPVTKSDASKLRSQKQPQELRLFVAIHEPSPLRLAPIHPGRLTALKLYMAKTVAALRKLTRNLRRADRRYTDFSVDGAPLANVRLTRTIGRAAPWLESNRIATLNR
jgi:hypothetical protein